MVTVMLLVALIVHCSPTAYQVSANKCNHFECVQIGTVVFIHRHPVLGLILYCVAVNINTECLHSLDYLFAEKVLLC